MDASLTATKGHLRQAIDDKIKPLEDSIRVLKYHRNALAPISTLPPEILTDIFSILSYSACHARASDNEKVGYLAWLWVTHVCRHWREIALNHPRLWGHINFTKLTPAGIDAILARAKMTPLHLEATVMSEAQFDAFGQQLETHISHIRRLSLLGQIPTVLERIISSSPALESLSLRNAPNRYSSRSSPTIPLSLLNITAPKLASLELIGCDISWKSPLLRGLRTLDILRPSREARPTLDDWLDALNEMAQLETLTLDSASPIVPVGDRFTSEPSHTVTLPFLTRFDITASAKGCELALAHLVFPALTSLSVEAASYRRDGDDVLRVIPHIARNARGPAPLRSMAISANRLCALICAWTIPDADAVIADSGSMSYGDESSARVVLCATSSDMWRYGTGSEIVDALLTHLPINEISTLSTWDDTRLSKEVWFRHAPRLAMLNRAYLVSTTIKAFREMISIVAPGERPRLPRLTKLILGHVTLTTLMTCNLLCMLMKRMEQGAPLQSLDLRTCNAADLCIQVLAKAVGELQVPVELLTIGDPATFSDTDNVTDVHYDSFEGEGDESDYTDF